jgi:carbamoyl-phosphate synthase large subunit
MNVLLTSVGRRAYLVDYFKEALGGSGKVIATNTIAETTGMFAADDAIVVPAAKDPGFVDSLLEICRTHEVSLLCSLHDWEAPYIAASAERFEALGVCLAMPTLEIVNICLDKYKTFLFAERNGVRSPKTYLNEEDVAEALSRSEIDFPLVLKPRWGQGSIGLRMVHDLAELASACNSLNQEIKDGGFAHLADADADTSQIVIQECLIGQEFGVDILNNLDGAFAACFVKKKLGMRAGETDSAITVKHSGIEAMGRTISKATRHFGNMDADFFELENGEVALLELNPRFGGGYPFSHLAGANVPAALVAWRSGRVPDSQWLNFECGVRGFKDVRVVGPNSTV